MSEFLTGVGAVLGVLLLGGGVWLLYGWIVNVDPESELPRWLLLAVGAPVLAIGVWLLVNIRWWLRKQRRSVRA